MSNFICPTCGFSNIDCGKDGYKTTREIELEKENKRLKEGAASIARGQTLVDELGDYEAIIEHIKGLNKKLEIAVKVIDTILNDEFILEHADAGLLMYLQVNRNKIKGDCRCGRRLNAGLVGTSGLLLKVLCF